MTDLRVNINDEVLVRLTEEGRRIYRAYFGRDCPPPDEEGQNGFQLWTLMTLFGRELHMGMVNMPFKGNEVRIKQ